MTSTQGRIEHGPFSSPQSLTNGHGLPQVWILKTGGAGDNRQLSNLAQALGWPTACKRTLDPLPQVLWDRLYRPGWRQIPARKSAELGPPWPDLVLFGGGRCVIDALRIRAASGGRTRLVCVGRPWAPLAWFDRVITTPQYRLPEQANVLQNLLPLNRPDAVQLAAAARDWEPRLAHLPRPWLGLLLGGNSGSYRFTATAARRLGQQVNAHARATGGALLITSSARTPAGALEALLAEIDVPHYCHRWQLDHSDNPLEAILALADSFMVTADSASMLAEACYSGRPVAAFVPPLRWRARLLAGSALPGRLLRRLPGVAALRRQLIARGCWFPARDMGYLHAALQEHGLIRPLTETQASAGIMTVQPGDMERALASIRSLFPELEKDLEKRPPATQPLPGRSPR